MTGPELESFIKSNELTNHSFADLVGVTKTCVDYWIVEHRKIPPTVVKLVKFFYKRPDLIKEYAA